MIEPVDVFWKCNKGYLSIVHSLPNGDILIANMGDPAGNGKGIFPYNKTMNNMTGWKDEYSIYCACPLASQEDLLCWMERPLS